MSKVNPFDSQSNEKVDIGKMAEEIALSIREIVHNKGRSYNPDRNENSDNSISSFPISKLHMEGESSVGGKRENTVKITSIARKRVQAVSLNEGGNNEDSQYIDSVSNRKITEYFGERRKTEISKVIEFDRKDSHSDEDHEDEHQIEYENDEVSEDFVINNHPVIKNFKDIIQKKKKLIEELENQIEKIKDKNQRIQEDTQNKLEIQRNVVIEFMSRRFDQRIYNQRLKELRSSKKEEKEPIKILSEVNSKIEKLESKIKNEKGKKIAKNKNNNEEVNFIEIYGEEKKEFLTLWKKRLESEKGLLEKEIQRAIPYENMELIEEKYFPLPELFLDKNGSTLIFDKNYLPLYCRNDPDLISISHALEVRVLNLSNLLFENWSLISYSKIMRIEKRMEMKSHLKSVHEKSLILNDNSLSSMFLNNTIFSQISNIYQEFIVIGRTVWEEDSPTITLKHILKRYDTFSEPMAKYMIKFIIRAYERIKKTLSMEPILFPENIIFNEKCTESLIQSTCTEILIFKIKH